MKVCPYSDCQKALSTAYKLKLHIQRCHFNLRLFRCVHCLKFFKSNDSLKRHQFCHRIPADLALREKNPLGRGYGQVEVPKLTDLLLASDDLDLCPMVHIERVYPFTYHFSKVYLPAIRPRESSL